MLLTIIFYLVVGTIVGLLGKFPVHGCLAAETTKPIMDAEHSTVALGDWTIHSGYFTKCVELM